MGKVWAASYVGASVWLCYRKFVDLISVITWTQRVNERLVEMGMSLSHSPSLSGPASFEWPQNNRRNVEQKNRAPNRPLDKLAPTEPGM